MYAAFLDEGTLSRRHKGVHVWHKSDSEGFGNYFSNGVVRLINHNLQYLRPILLRKKHNVG